MYTKQDGKLHVRLLQHRTATGRFSGADPNMQNMPRGGTFLSRRCSCPALRGKILGLTLHSLSSAPLHISPGWVPLKKYLLGLMYTRHTAKVITDAGQPTDRQTAKAHTFAPLYGATGFGRTPAEAEYTHTSPEKYKGIGVWHSRLAKEAVNTRKITTPSGREFAFPDVVRKASGRVSLHTDKELPCAVVCYRRHCASGPAAH